jgi:hypothetical protein
LASPSSGEAAKPKSTSHTTPAASASPPEPSSGAEEALLEFAAPSASPPLLEPSSGAEEALLELDVDAGELAAGSPRRGCSSSTALLELDAGELAATSPPLLFFQTGPPASLISFHTSPAPSPEAAEEVLLELAAPAASPPLLEPSRGAEEALLELAVDAGELALVGAGAEEALLELAAAPAPGSDMLETSDCASAARAALAPISCSATLSCPGTVLEKTGNLLDIGKPHLITL